MEKEMKLALLIDAENISSKYIDVILREADNWGNVIYKRIYGNWTAPEMRAWRPTILDNSILPIQQYSNVGSKNASDAALIIDAMDLLYQGRLNGFCIVSSDSDFTRLASRLRESEMFVLGMGERKTPRSFISACSKFSYLDLLIQDGTVKKPETGKKAAKAAAPEPEREESAHTEDSGADLKVIKRVLRELAEENSDDDGWIYSAQLRSYLGKRFPDFDVRNFGHKKFVPFIESLDLFEVDKRATDDNTKLVYFRVR